MDRVLGIPMPDVLAAYRTQQENANTLASVRRQSKKNEAIQLGERTSLAGYTLIVIAITWFIGHVMATDMPAVVRLILQTCVLGGGTTLLWLGERIRSL